MCGDILASVVNPAMGGGVRCRLLIFPGRTFPGGGMGTGAVKQSRMRKQSIWQSRPSLATPNPCATSTTEYGQSFLFVPARALKGWAELEGNENVGIWITIMPLCLPSKHKPCRKKKNNKHQSKPVKTAAPSTIPNHLTVPTSYPTTTSATPATPPPSSQP